jgi:hypothetical protein
LRASAFGTPAARSASSQNRAVIGGVVGVEIVSPPSSQASPGAAAQQHRPDFALRPSVAPVLEGFAPSAAASRREPIAQDHGTQTGQRPQA